MINYTTATIGKTTKTFKNLTSTRSRLNILKFLSVLVMVMMLGVNGVMGQSPTNGGFEGGATNWTTAGSTGSTNARTGSKALAHTITSTSNVAHTNSTSINISNNSYAHVIGWAVGSNANSRASCGGTLNITANSASSTTIGTSLTRLTYDVQNTTGSTQGFTCRLNTRSLSGSTILYWDDIIMYTDATATSDLTKPAVPTSFTNGSITSSSVGFSWTNGTDAGTGIQNTIILRTTNLSASTPVMNDQGVYTTAGGTGGPNVVTTDWTVISTSVLSSATAYTDNSVAASTSYKFAVVHRDLAYNYSTALVSGTITTPAGGGSTPPTLTAAGSATVDAPFNVTFPDDATWRAAITSITVGGTPLTAGSAVTAGQIAFTPSASTPASLLQSSGSKSIVVIATGYSNATVTQSIGVGAATRLGITTQPTAPATNGGALAAQPVVAIQDQYNNTTTSTATITAAVGAGTWTLGGTTSAAAVSGTTTYSGLTATSVASVTGATIAFTSAGLTGVTSGTFDIPAPPVAPTVTSPTSASIVNTTATLGGNVTSNGGAAITARGVVWSVNTTNSNPTIGGGGVTNVVGTGTNGAFTVNATLLPPNTVIAYRAYATNSVGTTYTTATTFTTLSVATKLVFGTPPAGTGNAGVNLTTFTVQAQRADNSVDAEYVANVAIARNIVSGSAALTGTTSVAAVAGTATFSAVQFNAGGTYTLTASSAALTTATSGNVVVSLVIYKEDFGTTSNTTLPYSYGTSSTGSASLNSNLTAPSWSQSLSNAQFAGNTDGAMTASNISSTYTVNCTTTVASGYQMNPTSISFDSRITSTGPTTLNISISGTGGGSTSISSYTLDRGNTFVTVSPQSFTNTSLNLTGTVTLTFSYSGSGGGNARLDNVTLSGNVVCIPATASVLSTTTPAICNGGSAGNIRVTITGGASPFSVVYNDGTGNTTQSSYTSGSNISVTPSSPTTYTLVSVTDANSCVSAGLSGSATITPVSGATNATLASSNAAPAEQCTDGAGWTYYATSGAPTQLLFAIKKNGNTFTATPNITVGSTIVKTSSNGANQQHGMWLMGRYWDATLASGSISISNPVSVRFYYNPADATAAMTARDNAFTALPGGTLAVKNSASGEWFKTPNGTTLNAGYISSIVGNKFPAGVLKPTTVTGTENGVNYVEYQGLTGFSGGTLGFSFGPNNGGGANSLPVTWAYFTAQKTDGGNQLDWGTASEKNTSHFEIEYSVDGSQFIAMNNKINAAGNSAHLLEYRCIHKLSPPLIYYRIKQIDLDGLYDYSKTIILKNKDVTSKNFIKVLPSYVQGQEPLIIQGYESNMPFVFYEIINGQGQRILSDKIPTIDGYFHHSLSLEMYPTGLYYLRVFNSDLDNIYQGKIRK
jgi:hypothetical protein